MGRNPLPSAGVADSQTTKTTGVGGMQRGIEQANCTEEEDEGEAHERGDEHGEEGYGHEHRESGREYGGGAKVEYPLSEVRSDSEGHRSSTTTFTESSVEELFSGEPKLVNVHEAGSDNPHVLSCADLKRVG